MTKSNKKHYNYWTYEKCKEVILKLDSISELKKNYRGAYSSCKRNNWECLFTNLKENLLKPKGYWTKDRLKEEASKYKSKKEFRENNISAYTISNKLKIMDEICKHMV